ncbi:MAG: hypothetical protein ICV68_16695 [Pyrinomonadaceae bacterium]|nr:hypothetical protein [Pyrinomonadaceae bacterium]
MTRTCTVCAHAEVHAVNVALVAREPYRHIAARYSLSTGALRRHSEEHIPQLLVQARGALEALQADDLLAELRSEKEDIQRLKGLAEDGEDYRTALLAIDKALKALELQARVAQLIDERPTVNLYLSSEWMELRAVIVGALEPHPEARESVLRALEGAGNGSAR